MRQLLAWGYCCRVEVTGASGCSLGVGAWVAWVLQVPRGGYCASTLGYPLTTHRAASRSTSRPWNSATLSTTLASTCSRPPPRANASAAPHSAHTACAPPRDIALYRVHCRSHTAAATTAACSRSMSAASSAGVA